MQHNRTHPHYNRISNKRSCIRVLVVGKGKDVIEYANAVEVDIMMQRLCDLLLGSCNRLS